MKICTGKFFQLWKIKKKKKKIVKIASSQKFTLYNILSLE